MPRWMTEEQAQEYLAVSRSTLYRWRRDGRLPYYKAGKITRYKQEDLDAVLERQEPDTEN